jgi:predicted phage terminase large subunit-like protein
LVCDFRKEIAENRDLLKRAYLLTARDHFDDFMIYIEWDRPLKEKYWLPRRSKLLPLCNALQELEDGQLDELFLSQPPRTGKTTLILFFLTWIMLRDSERSNLYCSYTDSVVKVLYSGILEVLNDTTTYLWRDVFPECEVVSTDAKDLLININRKKRYASFTGRSLYGTLNGACDCNGYAIGDDLISGIEEAMNKDRLNNAWSKVDNNFLPRAKQNAKILWIGTRWSLTDPIARRYDVLTNEPKYKNRRFKVVNIPALNENDESNFDYACGVGFDSEFYQQRRASFERNDDTASWLAQYMGTPIERDGAVFSPDELRYYNGDLPDGDPDRVFMAVDPSWGGGDYVASPIIYQYGTDLFVADVIYSNLEKDLTQAEVVSKAMSHKVTCMHVEGNKMTGSYGQDIARILKEKGYRCNVQVSTKHFTGTGKEQRIFDKAPDIRQNMIFRDKRDKEYELFMQNVFSFSIMGKNKHDDAPDSLAMAVTFLIIGESRVEVAKRRF